MNKKSKRMGRTMISGALVLSMVLCNSSFVEAKKVSKQESVYVNAGADGTVNQITVADWLKNSGAMTGTIQDSSDLTDITNVKGDEKFTQSGSSVDWDTSGNDIYYQGKTTKELPVDVKITYSLDGKEMEAKDMLGKSGKVEIHVSYTNKSKQTRTVNGEKVDIYTPFVMVTGMILSTDNFTNVDVDNGRIISEGSNNIVVGLGTPGLAESLDLDDEYADKLSSDFTVTADVTDFSMGNTFTYGSPSLLDELNLDEIDDLDDLEEKLDDLTDAASKLVDGSDTLADNMETFSNKMGELEKSIRTFQKDGVKKVTGGIDTLAKSGPQLVKGVNEYANGVTSFAKGTTSYVSGASKITSGCSTLYGAVKDLPTQLKTFDTGLKTYTSSVDKMGSKENVAKLKGGAKSVSDGITTINTNLTELKKSYAASEALVKQLKASGADAAIVAQLEAVTKGQKEAIEQLEAATGENSDLKKGAASVSAGVSTVMDGLSKLSSNSSQLTTATKTLNEKMPQLVSSVKQLKEGGDKLSKNNKTLTKAAKSLTKASTKMKKNVKKVNSGMKTLQKGGKSLNKATGKLVTGVAKLNDASGKLDDGADKLAVNLEKFNDEGVKKLNNVYEDDLKTMIDRLNAVIAVGKDYKSFSGLGKSMNGEVKFIIETDAVEKDE